MKYKNKCVGRYLALNQFAALLAFCRRRRRTVALRFYIQVTSRNPSHLLSDVALLCSMFCVLCPRRCFHLNTSCGSVDVQAPGTLRDGEMCNSHNNIISIQSIRLEEPRILARTLHRTRFWRFGSVTRAPSRGGGERRNETIGGYLNAQTHGFLDRSSSCPTFPLVFLFFFFFYSSLSR